MSVVIKAENLSKVYQLGNFGTGTISRDLERFLARIRGKEDPFLKIGESNDRTKKGGSDIVWSLKDIDFEVGQGDTLGIIGRNGAGKSTLLKILARVTSPSAGSVKIKGRVASLLEVGTGFHPELTGKENIYLNGTILGMRKAEIKQKFDEIVDFAGVERYTDTPVKRYSSGMYVRLAFAVAAHLDSEILIIDEVLAVGDAEFQKKCVGKMGDISKGEGRTILFVSHNMGSIVQICNKGILLENGTIKYLGGIAGCINAYLNNGSKFNEYMGGPDSLHIGHIYFIDQNQKRKYSFKHDEYIHILFIINKIKALPPKTNLTVILRDEFNRPVFATHHQLEISRLHEIHHATMTVPDCTLLPGSYKVEVLLHVPNLIFIEKVQDKLELIVEDSGHIHSPYPGLDFGRINVKVTWA